LLRNTWKKKLITASKNMFTGKTAMKMG